jgi:glycosyltransferase involved in cell wall biosynthesis
MNSGLRTILFVHASDEMYGADIILLQLVEGLDKTFFRPIVVLPNDMPYEGQLSKALQAKQVYTIRMNIAVLRRRYFTPWGFFLYFWRLAASTLAMIRLIRQESVDLVHTQTAAVIPGALAARLTGTPHVWHALEIIVKPRFLWRFTSWLLPRLSNQVVAASGPTLNHLCAGNHLNEKKAIVIHNGVDLDRFTRANKSGQEVRKEWGIETEQPLIGMVGRVSSWKGQDYFLKVAQLVAQSHPEARFALVGGTIPGQEDLFVKIKAMVKELGLEQKVIVNDFRSDIPAVLDAYDVFVLPSTLPDPFPTVLLEAMAASKPVVANAHGGSTEMVDHGQTGFLVHPDKQEEMALAIQYLIEHPEERSCMGQRGKERLEANFSLKSFTIKWNNLYKSLVQEWPGKTFWA